MKYKWQNRISTLALIARFLLFKTLYAVDKKNTMHYISVFMLNYLEIEDYLKRFDMKHQKITN